MMEVVKVWTMAAWLVWAAQRDTDMSGMAGMAGMDHSG